MSRTKTTYLGNIDEEPKSPREKRMRTDTPKITEDMTAVPIRFNFKSTIIDNQYKYDEIKDFLTETNPPTVPGDVIFVRPPGASGQYGTYDQTGVVQQNLAGKLCVDWCSDNPYNPIDLDRPRVSDSPIPDEGGKSKKTKSKKTKSKKRKSKKNKI